MKTLLRPALLFVAIGLAIYLALYAASEALVWRHGRSNPLFKVARLEQADVDWVVLGASHAMPLDFDDFNAGLQRASGQRLLHLAGPGTGPLYNRFVLEQFLQRHRARQLLYAVDAFAFYSRTWNEERFSDARLLRRTPWDPAVAAGLMRYVRDEGVDMRAWLDYVSGFSKINNRERFEADAWEGEAQFERVARPSKSAISKRIAYLYPHQTHAAARERYLAAFSALLDLARRHGMQVVLVKMPLPAALRAQIPGEAEFDAALQRVAALHGARLVDFSGTLPDARLYFDTDHLNRQGLTAFAETALLPLLAPPGR
jgi:hypothetical protein